MGIYITWRIIKTIINTNLNGIALHKVYGWSVCHLVISSMDIAHTILHIS